MISTERMLELDNIRHSPGLSRVAARRLRESRDFNLDAAIRHDVRFEDKFMAQADKAERELLYLLYGKSGG